MVCQMEAWTLELSFASKNMRMQTMKSTLFTWNTDCQAEFLKIKEVIGKVDFLAPFDISLPLEMYTDTSRLGGLAYILVQPKGDGKHKFKSIIQCGSTARQQHKQTIQQQNLNFLQFCGDYRRRASTPRVHQG